MEDLFGKDTMNHVQLIQLNLVIIRTQREIRKANHYKRKAYGLSRNPLLPCHLPGSCYYHHCQSLGQNTQHLQRQRRIVLRMPATSVERLKQSVLGVNHVKNAGRRIRSVFMEMAKETRNESETSNILDFLHGLRE